MAKPDRCSRVRYVVVADPEEVTLQRLTELEAVQSFPYAFLIDRRIYVGAQFGNAIAVIDPLPSPSSIRSRPPTACARSSRPVTDERSMLPGRT